MAEMATAELASNMNFSLANHPRQRAGYRATVRKTAAAAAGMISGTDVDCRVFEYNRGDLEVPPKEMLADAILKKVFGPPDGIGSCVILRMSFPIT
jgi:hypothetical protein